MSRALLASLAALILILAPAVASGNPAPQGSDPAIRVPVAGTRAIPPALEDSDRIGIRWVALRDGIGILDYRQALRMAAAVDRRRYVRPSATGVAPVAGSATRGGPAPSTTPQTGDALLYSIAGCESHMNPEAISATGAFRGAWQFTLSTYHANGGVGDPVNASLATQLVVARRVMASQGPGAWPICSRR
jgi:hypothetical protein